MGSKETPHISIYKDGKLSQQMSLRDFNINTGYIADAVYDGNHSIYFAGEEGGYGGNLNGHIGLLSIQVANKQNSPLERGKSTVYDLKAISFADNGNANYWKQITQHCLTSMESCSPNRAISQQSRNHAAIKTSQSGEQVTFASHGVNGWHIGRTHNLTEFQSIVNEPTGYIGKETSGI